MTTSAADQPTSKRTFNRKTRRILWTVAFLFVSLTAAGPWCGTPAFAQDAGSSSVSEPDAAGVMELRGETMGTTYMVKVYGADGIGQDLALDIDAELRQVNDQMSTYLKSSELSRFNASESTEWFDVSSDTALVVQAALKISLATDGAFDPTVGPLVELWNFGPGKTDGGVPAEAEIAKTRRLVGYRNLEARLDPAGLKKSVSGLRVDLSAIAKGHGVDRVVKLLNSKGAQDVFVEIGGEIRTTGQKGADPWMVGIQKPDAATNEIQVAHPLSGGSIATSGDYRNYFSEDGKRYSHTIDASTGRPVDHQTASVTVIADDCMQADAWATAINVLGADKGLDAARENDLSVLVISRDDAGYAVTGTGVLAPYADIATAGQVAESSTAFPVMLLTMLIFGCIVVAMAVGVIFGRKAISGSCGGLNAQTHDDGSTSCTMCGTPSDACKELRAAVKKKPKLDPLEG